MDKKHQNLTPDMKPSKNVVVTRYETSAVTWNSLLIASIADVGAEEANVL